MSSTTDKKECAMRKRWRDTARHHTALADKLAEQGAPAILIDAEHHHARAARLRSWGWIGPVPRMRSIPEGPR